jgi:hypothetical protein
MPGQIESCKLIIRLNMTATNGRNPSDGGICTLNHRDIMLCNDIMVGKLTDVCIDTDR